MRFKQNMYIPRLYLTGFGWIHIQNCVNKSCQLVLMESENLRYWCDGDTWCVLPGWEGRGQSQADRLSMLTRHLDMAPGPQISILRLHHDKTGIIDSYLWSVEGRDYGYILF